MKKIIVNFGVYEHGHEIGYMSIILSFILKHNIQNNYVFLLNRKAEVLLKEQHKLLPKDMFLFLTEIEQNEINSSKKLFLKKNKEWKIIKKYSAAHNCSEILLMSIDQYLPSIFLGGTSKNISGIYFRPSTRIYKETTSFKTRLLYYIKKSKKITLEFFLFKIYQGRIKNIFLLNDLMSVSSLNKTFGDYFIYLEDPIFEHKILDADIDTVNIVDNSKIVFLLFGSISPRKNVENILRAFELLPNDIRSKATLLIAGSITTDYREAFYAFLNHIMARNKDLDVFVDERFLSDHDMHKLFKKSDLILIPYKDLYTSSGILGISASYDKPCMVSKIGLLAELVDEFSLGIKVNPFSPEDISEKMIKFVDQPLKAAIDGKKFCASHTPEKFVRSLLRY